MLKALLNGLSVYAWRLREEDRGADYRCQFCDGRMGLVLPRERVNHFRHQDKSSCVGESWEHILMKHWAIHKLAPANNLDAEPEVPMNGHIIDVQMGDYAIECQHSYMTQDELRSRTQDLNEAGLYVLWLANMQRFTGQRINMDQLNKFLHRLYYGRIYSLLVHEDVSWARIIPVHLRYLKTTRKREIERGPMIWQHRLKKKTVTDKYGDGSKYRLAFFHDLPFWQTTPAKIRYDTSSRRIVSVGEGYT